MFESNIRNSLPGYTGHIPGRIDDDYIPPQIPNKKQIPGKISHFPIILYLNSNIIGYGGYVPGVKSENVFGLTYGKTSQLSAK